MAGEQGTDQEGGGLASSAPCAANTAIMRSTSGGPSCGNAAASSSIIASPLAGLKMPSQRAPGVARVRERVHGAGGHVDDRAAAGADRRLTDEEVELAVEDVPDLLESVGVHVWWRTGHPWGDARLDHRERAVRRLRFHQHGE